MVYFFNVDLVNDNEYTKYDLILSIRSQDIKGHNCVANLRKTTIYNTNVDLVNDDEHTKFCLILSISYQEKPNSDINQGP